MGACLGLASGFENSRFSCEAAAEATLNLFAVYRFYMVFNGPLLFEAVQSILGTGAAVKHLVYNPPGAVHVSDAGIWAGCPKALLALAWLQVAA